MRGPRGGSDPERRPAPEGRAGPRIDAHGPRVPVGGELPGRAGGPLRRRRRARAQGPETGALPAAGPSPSCSFPACEPPASPPGLPLGRSGRWGPAARARGSRFPFPGLTVAESGAHAQERGARLGPLPPSPAAPAQPRSGHTAGPPGRALGAAEGLPAAPPGAGLALVRRACHAGHRGPLLGGARGSWMGASRVGREAFAHRGPRATREVSLRRRRRGACTEGAFLAGAAPGTPRASPAAPPLSVPEASRGHRGVAGSVPPGCALARGCPLPGAPPAPSSA